MRLANSAVALPGGRFPDLLATPAATNRWLTEHDLAPPGAGLQESCAAPLRTLREQIRALLASRADGHCAPPSALATCGSSPCTRCLRRHGRRHWCATRCGDRVRAARAYARRARPQAP